MRTFACYVRHRNGWGTGCGPKPTHCSKCRAELPERDSGAAGYGTGKDEPVTDGALLVELGARDLKKGEFIVRAPAVCYACCGEDDRADMVATGKALLYLTTKDGRAVLTNWPDSLSFPVTHKRTGRHNLARTRYDVWFTGPDGAPWHGVQYGDNTQICRCKRLKAQS